MAMPDLEKRVIEFRKDKVSNGAENLILQSIEYEISENEVVPCLPFISTRTILNCSDAGGVELSFLHEKIARSVIKMNSLFTMK